MRTNYVLIDFENVQPDSLDKLDQDHFKVLLFVGANQGKLRSNLASSLQRLGDRAKRIKISGNGRNALDFHIAYYIGRFSAVDTTGYFHIVSKDAGFDPLIRHLKMNKVSVRRARAISEIVSANAKPSTELIEMVLGMLRQLKAAKPKTVDKLVSTIAARFSKHVSHSEIPGLINELSTKGYVTVSGSKVSYAV
jgi:hypothetical protein